MPLATILPQLSLLAVNTNQIAIGIVNFGQNSTTLSTNVRLYISTNSNPFTSPVVATISRGQTSFAFNNLRPQTLYYIGCYNNLNQKSNVIAVTTAGIPSPTPTPTKTPTPTPSNTPKPLYNKPNWVSLATGQRYSSIVYAIAYNSLSGAFVNTDKSEISIFDGNRIAGASPLSLAPSGKVFQVPVMQM